MARLNVAFPRALDINADPVSGGKLYVYAAGTTTPVTTYSDVGLTVAQSHPVLADAYGHFATVYVPDGAYKAVIKDASDATLVETDNIEVYDSSRDVWRFDTYAAAQVGDTGAATYIQVADMLYVYDASGTALTTGDGRKWSPVSGLTTFAQFGAVGDDATDDTAALQAAFDWVAAGDGRRIVENGRLTYLTTAPITTSGSIDVDLGASKIHANHNGRIIDADAGYTAYALTADYVKEALTIAVATTGTALASNRYIKVGGNSIDPGARDEGSNTNQYRTAEWLTVADGTTTTSIALSEPLRFVTGIDTTSVAGDEAREDAYTTANNARIFVPNIKRFRLVGGEIYYTDGQEATWSGAAIRVAWYSAPVFEDVRITRGYGAGIQLAGTQAAEINRCTFSRLENNTGNGQYGYAVADAGYMTNVTNCVFIDCRHGYTTNCQNVAADYTASLDAAQVGRCVGARISNCRGYDFDGGSPFDTHQDAEDVIFSDCIAERCQGYAFTLRGRNITASNPTWRNCQDGLYVYTEYESGDPDDDFFTAGKTSDDFTWAFISGANGQCSGTPFVFSHARVVVDGTFRARTTTHKMVEMSGEVTWNASGRFTTTNFDNARSYTAENSVGVFDVDDVNSAASAAFPGNSSLLFGKGCNVFNAVSNATGTGIVGVHVEANSSCIKRGRVTFDLPSGMSVLGGTLANISWLTDGKVDVTDFGAVGNNSTNCTTAIQEAVDYAATRGTVALNKAGIGATVHFPSGVYQIDSKIVVEGHGVVIEGEGPNTSIIRQTDETEDIIEFAGADPFNTGNADAIAARPENQGIHDIGLYIDGSDHTNALTSKAIVCRRSLVWGSNIRLRGYHTGLYLSGVAEGTRFSDMYFQSSRGGTISGALTDDAHVIVTAEQVDSSDALATAGGDGNYYDRSVGVFLDNLQTKDPASTYGVQDALRVECCDGVYVTNSHLGFAHRANICFVPKVQSFGILNVMGENLFLDGNDAINSGPTDYSVAFLDPSAWGTPIEKIHLHGKRANMGDIAAVMFDAEGAKVCSVRGFSFNSAFASASGADGFVVNHGEDITISDNFFDHCPDNYGYVANNANIDRLTITDNSFRDKTGRGNATKGIVFDRVPNVLELDRNLIEDVTGAEYEFNNAANRTFNTGRIEGTWTVAVTDASGNESSTTSGGGVTGEWHRNGKLVKCIITNVSNINTAGLTAGDNLRISLPFSQNVSRRAIGHVRIQSLASALTGSDLIAVAPANQSYLEITASNGTGAQDTMLVSDISSGATDILDLEIEIVT